MAKEYYTKIMKTSDKNKSDQDVKAQQAKGIAKSIIRQLEILESDDGSQARAVPNPHDPDYVITWTNGSSVLNVTAAIILGYYMEILNNRELTNVNFIVDIHRMGVSRFNQYEFARTAKASINIVRKYRFATSPMNAVRALVDVVKRSPTSSWLDKVQEKVDSVYKDLSKIRYDDTAYKADPDKIEQAKLADASRCFETIFNIIETQQAHKGKDDDIDLEHVSTVLDDKQLGITRRHKVSSSSSYVQQSSTTTANELWSHDVNNIMTYIQCGNSPENSPEAVRRC